MKLSKRIIAILLTLCFIMGGMISVNASGETQNSTVWGGEKDIAWYEADPTAKVFHIDTANELAGLAQLVNAGTEDFEERTIVLDKDIVLNSGVASSWESSAPNNTWTPIGCEEHKFKGTFVGNGHTVSGIYYSDIGETTGDNIGLFGCVEGATIKKVRVENTYLHGRIKVGGIVGMAYGVTITDCYSSVNIQAEGNEGSIGGYAGILGFNESAPATIKGCWVAGKIYNLKGVGAGSSGRNYSNGTGGIVGCFNVSGNVIDDCLVTAEINGTSHVGGVVGRCNEVSGNVVTIKDTLMLGTVSAHKPNKTTFGGEFIGIMMGTATATMTNVYGKSGFTLALDGDCAPSNTYSNSESVWAANKTGSVVDDKSNAWSKTASDHRLSDAALKALVGVGEEKKLAVGEWAVVEGKDYPIPAYFAPAQFLGVQFAVVDSDYYNARFVGTIGDTEGYTKVGFEILLWDGVDTVALKYDLSDATVYTSILAGTSSGIDDEITVEGKSLIALTIMNIPTKYCKYQIRTFVSDGTNTIYGKTVTMDRPATWNQ